jgi:hypothetical protein
MEYIYILYDTINDNPICFSRHRAELYYFIEIYNIKDYRIMRVPHVADCGDWFFVIWRCRWAPPTVLIAGELLWLAAPAEGDR